jgi:hypothetical protein
MFSNVLDAEVVNDEGEQDGTPFVAPEALWVLASVISMWCEAFRKEIVGNDTSLWESIHAAGDADVDIAFLDKGHEVVLVDDLLRNDFDG